MTSEIGGGDTYILSVDPNSDGITILSGTGPAGPAGAPGEPGPEGPAFQGNAIALINPATGEAYQPNEALLVTGSLDVEIPPITIPPIDIEFPAEINANVVNWPASTLVMVGNDDPIEVTIAGGVSQFDGQLVQGGAAVSPTNRLFVDATVSGTVSLPSSTVVKSITDPVGVNILSGGSTFDGQLSQGGEAVSDANPLPTKVIGSIAVSTLPAVSLAAPVTLATGTEVGITGLVDVTGSVSISGVVSLDAGTRVAARLEIGSGPGPGMAISESFGLPVKPDNTAVFRVAPTNDVFNVAVQNPELAVTVSGTPTVALSGPVEVTPTNSALFESNVRQGGLMVGEGNPLFIQPPSNAVFTVKLDHNGFGTNTLGVNLMGTPEVTISGTPTVVVSGPVAMTPEFSSLAIGKASVATGTTPTALASATCKAVELVNAGTVDMEYRLGGAGEYMILAAKSADMVWPITNANQISVRHGAASVLPLTYKVLA